MIHLYKKEEVPPARQIIRVVTFTHNTAAQYIFFLRYERGNFGVSLFIYLGMSPAYLTITDKPFSYLVYIPYPENVRPLSCKARARNIEWIILWKDLSFRNTWLRCLQSFQEKE